MNPEDYLEEKRQFEANRRRSIHSDELYGYRPKESRAGGQRRRKGVLRARVRCEVECQFNDRLSVGSDRHAQRFRQRTTGIGVEAYNRLGVVVLAGVAR